MSGAVNNTGVPYYSGLLFEEIAHHFFTIRYVSSECSLLLVCGNAIGTDLSVVNFRSLCLCLALL